MSCPASTVHSPDSARISRASPASPLGFRVAWWTHRLVLSAALAEVTVILRLEILAWQANAESPPAATARSAR
jgi:hypothetical protein